MTDTTGTEENVDTQPGEPAAIGRRVQRLRTAAGLTQRQLAEPSYTAAYVSMLEAGRVRPSEVALRHLAGRLGVTSDELLTGRPAHVATDLRARLLDAQGLLATGSAGRAAAVYTGLLAEAREHDLNDECAAAILGLGQCALESGDLAEAMSRFEEAERLLADEPLPRRIRAVRGRALTHLLAGELRYACYLLENTIAELESGDLGDPDALVLLHTAIIAPYMDMGAYARAAQAAEIALQLAPQVSDPALVASMHRTVARTLIAQGRTAEAEASLTKAAELYQQLQIRTELAHCHWMRGYVHAQEGDLERAEAELRTARDMLATQRAVLYTAQVEVELADVLRRRGRPAEAVDLLRPLVADTRLDSGTVHAGAAHRLLGLIAEEAGEDDSAERHYGAAVTLLERAGAAGDLADICLIFGDLLRRQGRTEAALDIYRTGLRVHTVPGSTTLGPARHDPLSAPSARRPPA